MSLLLPTLEEWISDDCDDGSEAESVGAMDSPDSPVEDCAVDEWLQCNDTQCNEWHYEGGDLVVVAHAAPLPLPPPVSPRLVAILRSFQLEEVASVRNLRDAICMDEGVFWRRN